jgi:hypothetical protein
MERDQGAWVVHRHVIDVRLGDAEAGSWERAYDLGRVDGALDAPPDPVPAMATPGTMPSPRGGPSPAL